LAGAAKAEVTNAIAEIEDEDLACRSESWRAPDFKAVLAPMLYRSGSRPQPR
jgi:hypothetical protein